jgi:hypothetical protein
MIDTLTNTECLAPLQWKLEEHIKTTNALKRFIDWIWKKYALDDVRQQVLIDAMLYGVPWPEALAKAKAKVEKIMKNP